MEQFSKESITSKRTRPSNQQDEESQISAVIEGINEAFRAKDLDKIMSFYAEDVVAYDMMPPLEFNGRDEYRKAWKMGLDGMSEVGAFEDTHRQIHVSGDLAILHSLCHMTGTLKKDNRKMDMWSRYTSAFKKIDDKWLIIHEQFSVPIDMESEKAIWDLKPNDTGPMH